MRNPFQVLCLSTSPPDLVTSPFGPFVVQACADLAAMADALHESPSDALLIDCRTPQEADRLMVWPGLAHAAMDCAIVVVAPEPTPAQCLRLLQAGAQDVMARRDLSDELVGRVLRMAIERKRMDANARKALSTDLTTGLPTHSQLLEHMTHLLALREREPAAMALIVLRLEGFRGAETLLGAEAANVLRRKAAVRLRAALRASDVVASLGGDLYAVLLAWIDDQADAEGVARKLLGSLRQPFNVAGHDLPLSGSAGIGQYPAHGRDAASLLRRAVGQASNGEVGELGQERLGAANDS
ncbi:MAG TPA: GGDEF domain-containing protein [Burkholderiaceae bacterium]|nr:GGDEF domain-containing protein [Burkholderiaceae bacterium]